MDIQLTQRSVLINDTIINESLEQSIDSEFTLPDYCPDVERILKCVVTPKITSLSVTGSSVTVQGTANVNVLYCSKDKGDLRGYEMPVSFSKNYDSKSDCDSSFVTATVDNNYINCRAVNERKLDVHGAVTIKLRAVKAKETDVIVNSESDDIQLRRVQMDAMEMAGCTQKQIVINDELELGQSNGSVMNIIKYSADAIFEDCKFITNKAVIKGSLIVNLLYFSDDKRYERISIDLPINQIIDIEGVNEDSVCDIKMDVVSVELKPYTNADGECRSILATFKVNLNVCGFNQFNYNLITDAYSTKYEMDVTRMPMTLDRLVSNISAEHIIKATINLPEDSVLEIIDMWSTVRDINTALDDGEMTVTGKLIASIITMNNENECMYYEKEVPFEYKQRLNIDDNVTIEINAIIKNCSFNILSSDSIEIRCEVVLMGKASERLKNMIITDMQPDLNHPKSNDDMPALVVYYAKAGDSVWDIAMNYNTSPEVISELNKLTSDVLSQNKMLLIPSV